MARPVLTVRPVLLLFPSPQRDYGEGMLVGSVRG